jgi:hypothetical protein
MKAASADGKCLPVVPMSAKGALNRERKNRIVIPLTVHGAQTWTAIYSFVHWLHEKLQIHAQCETANVQIEFIHLSN